MACDVISINRSFLSRYLRTKFVTLNSHWQIQGVSSYCCMQGTLMQHLGLEMMFFPDLESILEYRHFIVPRFFLPS